jgi:hypothetical protein
LETFTSFVVSVVVDLFRSFNQGTVYRLLGVVGLAAEMSAPAWTGSFRSIQLHLVMDNGTHKEPHVKGWMNKHPRFVPLCSDQFQRA